MFFEIGGGGGGEVMTYYDRGLLLAPETFDPVLEYTSRKVEVFDTLVCGNFPEEEGEGEWTSI